MSCIGTFLLAAAIALEIDPEVVSRAKFDIPEGGGACVYERLSADAPDRHASAPVDFPVKPGVRQIYTFSLRFRLRVDSLPTDRKSDIKLKVQVPGGVWSELADARKYDARQVEIDPWQYVGSLKWVNPWGPYAWWDAERPYFYEKRLCVAPYTAAKDRAQEAKRGLLYPNTLPEI